MMRRTGMTQSMDDASGKMTRQRAIEMAAKALEISVDEAKQMPWEEIPRCCDTSGGTGGHKGS
jgi:hypothetical protein